MFTTQLCLGLHGKLTENTNLNWYLAETGDTEDSLVGVGEAWQVEENCILVEVV